jgi:diaminopimelate decarboxylase
MQPFGYVNGRLYAEAVPLDTLAECYGTPCYIYSRRAIEARWRELDQAFGEQPHLICYAVKANSNLAVLDVLARLGSGFDIVSAGELERVLAAGGRPERVVFSGVGKREDEIRRALEAGIHCFNVESEPELLRIDRIAGALGKRAPLALRVNPDVDAGTHPYIATGLKENKFGIPHADAARIYAEAARLRHIEVIGIACHIGSQITSIAPYADAARRIRQMIGELQAHGIALQHADLGGGLGVRYRDETPPSPGEWVAALVRELAGSGLRIIVEPGRAIVGEAGVLVTRIEYLKPGPDRSFAVVDAAMNDLIRPALYGAWQPITPVVARTDTPVENYDVVGPVCETADYFGRDRALSVRAGDLLAIGAAGAYGFSMSSAYNSRPRPCEVMVEGERHFLVRRRETSADLITGETRLPR